jgi:putative salt-induced outer membrane protein YdiY
MIRALSTLSTALLFAASSHSQLLAQGGPVTLTEEEKPAWNTTAHAGVTLTSGNSDSLLATLNILSTRNWAQNEMRLGADAAYGETEDVKSAESLRGFAQYNRLVSERWFGYLRLDALHDGVADVDYRISFSPGAGYYFIRTPQTTLSGEFGPGLIHEKQGGEVNTYMTLRLAERFEHQLNERVKIWQMVEVLPQVDDFNNFLVNAELGLETSLTRKLSLRVFAQDTYDNEPAPGRKKNDLKLVTALAYKFGN